jgi:hypothetical protein
MSMAETKAQREAREEQERADALAAQTQSDAEGAVDAPDVEAKAYKINVGDGHDELVFSRGVDEIARFAVKDGHVTVHGDGERAMVLSSVAGATLVE